MKKILALLSALCLVFLSGCGEQAKKVNPYSSTIEKTDVEPVEPAEPEGEYSASGGDYVGYDFIDDTDDGTPKTSLVEKGTSVPTLQTKWRAVTNAPGMGGTEALAQQMREKIVNTGNTSEYYTWTGKTYYVSPDGDDKNNGLSPKTAVKTIDADIFLTNPPQPGDAILFERGGLWRMTNEIHPREGVTYGSYGKGEKPTFYGSAANYASKENEDKWVASRKANVWKISVPDEDIGLIVFNHGEMVGRKRLNGVTTLEENGDYYYNTNDDTIYLYFDKGNPAKYFYDIEIGLKKIAFSSSKSNMVFDNLKIKYYGHGAIYFSTGANNNKITNCETGFIGGCLHHDDTRMGNCLQQWNSCDTQLIENNWMYQAYDTGYTFQGDDHNNPGRDEDGNMQIGDRAHYNNVTVTGNLIEYCNYAIEFWHLKQSDIPLDVQINNFHLTGNLLRCSGYGWGGMHRLTFTGYNIYVGHRDFKNARGGVIRDNILDVSSRSLMYWSFAGTVAGEWDIGNNTFYQMKNRKNEGMWFGGVRYAYDQATFEKAIASFDTTPKKVVWLDS